MLRSVTAHLGYLSVCFIFSILFLDFIWILNVMLTVWKPNWPPIRKWPLLLFYLFSMTSVAIPATSFLLICTFSISLSLFSFFSLFCQKPKWSLITEWPLLLFQPRLSFWFSLFPILLSLFLCFHFFVCLKTKLVPYKRMTSVTIPATSLTGCGKLTKFIPTLLPHSVYSNMI